MDETLEQLIARVIDSHVLGPDGIRVIGTDSYPTGPVAADIAAQVRYWLMAKGVQA